jgi:hypothetical protein
MVKGLQRFVEHFKGFENAYTLIGGAACDVWLTDHGLPFRATKDLDLVVIVEALEPAFFERFRAFIRVGRYRSHQQSESRPLFYRFTDPEASDYPFMIELLSRNQLDLPTGVHLTPIPVDEDISSLSAILLEDAYYHFVIQTRTIVSGVPIIPAQCLIPLKARAWLDLTARKTAGDANVKGDDIKKHRNDVFRLYRSLAPADRFALPDPLRADLQAFLAQFLPDSPDWPAILKAVGRPALPDPATILGQLRTSFNLSVEQT